MAFRARATGRVALTRSTLVGREQDNVIEIDGTIYPVVDVDTSSDSHPFWTGTARTLDSEGRSEKLSIGSYRPWGPRKPVTGLIFTGLGTQPSELEDAFDEILLTPAEARLDQRSWDVLEDGLEPWLGDIRPHC